MKSIVCCAALFFSVLILESVAKTDLGTEEGMEIQYDQSSDVGLHHRRFTVEYDTTTDEGQPIRARSTYTELQTGMHYLDKKGNWQESKEVIEIKGNTAVALQ